MHDLYSSYAECLKNITNKIWSIKFFEYIDFEYLNLEHLNLKYLNLEYLNLEYLHLEHLYLEYLKMIKHGQSIKSHKLNGLQGEVHVSGT